MCMDAIRATTNFLIRPKNAFNNHNSPALICFQYTATLHGVHAQHTQTRKIKASVPEYETAKKETVLFSLSHCAARRRKGGAALALADFSSGCRGRQTHCGTIRCLPFTNNVCSFFLRYVHTVTMHSECQAWYSLYR